MCLPEFDVRSVKRMNIRDRDHARRLKEIKDSEYRVGLVPTVREG
jgi:hypothetical protein